VDTRRKPFGTWRCHHGLTTVTLEGQATCLAPAAQFIEPSIIRMPIWNIDPYNRGFTSVYSFRYDFELRIAELIYGMIPASSSSNSHDVTIPPLVCETFTGWMGLACTRILPAQAGRTIIWIAMVIVPDHDRSSVYNSVATLHCHIVRAGWGIRTGISISRDPSETTSGKKATVCDLEISACTYRANSHCASSSG
jgi:hypothetical protein